MQRPPAMCQGGPPPSSFVVRPPTGLGARCGTVQHTILRTTWHVPTTGEADDDLGGDCVTNRDPRTPDHSLYETDIEPPQMPREQRQAPTCLNPPEPARGGRRDQKASRGDSTK
jgi:hypothetical protein